MCDYDTICTMEKMHESAARLFQAVEEIYPGEAITSAIARRMNVGDNLVTNWKTRGVSFQGAVIAEAVFGAPAAWILTGNKPPIKNSWPFAEWVNYEKVAALSRDELVYLAGKLAATLEEIEHRRA